MPETLSERDPRERIFRNSQVRYSCALPPKQKTEKHLNVGGAETASLWWESYAFNLLECAILTRFLAWRTELSLSSSQGPYSFSKRARNTAKPWWLPPSRLLKFSSAVSAQLAFFSFSFGKPEDTPDLRSLQHAFGARSALLASSSSSGAGMMFNSSGSLDFFSFTHPEVASEVLNGSSHLFYNISLAMWNKSCGEPLLDFTTAEKINHRNDAGHHHHRDGDWKYAGGDRGCASLRSSDSRPTICWCLWPWRISPWLLWSCHSWSWRTSREESGFLERSSVTSSSAWMWCAVLHPSWRCAWSVWTGE